MPEMRQNIITGQWVVVATERAKRPSDFSVPCAMPEMEREEDCPFCPGHELMTPLEVFANRPADTERDTPGWQVRVVPNRYPAFERTEPALETDSTFPRRPALGAHEVIINTPKHSATLATMTVDEVAMVLRVYRHRYRVHAEEPDVRYVHVIVNHGRESGASLEHSHSQLFAMPLVPPQVQQELAGAWWYHERNDRCVFCVMLENELEAGERIISQTDNFVVLAPFASRLPFEASIMPRFHQHAFDAIADDRLEEFAACLRDLLGRYVSKLGDPPYNLWIHTAPCDGTEYPYYHWHLEIIPKLTTPGGFELGTGMWINITTPEQATTHLR